ncbi:MAG: HPr family phosphocarrier protein [Lachnospiraceae bacterium]|nr:HPr family phosphocarrier protein [Lachnospiraceae bacterium]MDD6191790.1 HPr family phosphocarrier protein [Lachnospiraceae bacterium]MDY4793450.1 HPr family phosphocarrier protein [Pararoseburia sp.]
MTSVVVNINSIDKVKKFVNAITVYDNDFDLVCDRYVIDAKSIMGIFSLDLSQNLKLNIQKDNDVDAILADIDEFIVK